MNRRMALRILVLSLATSAARVGATQSGSVPVVGLLITHPPVTDPVVQALRDALREYGYEDGKNIKVEVRTALGQLDRVPALAQELVNVPADVIVLANEPALRAVRQATDTIPIVLVGYTDDPVTLGWIESYRRPGGNVTGIFNVNAALTSKRLEILKETLPQVSRVAVLWDPAFGKRFFGELQGAAGLLGLQLEFIEVTGLDGIEPAFKAAKNRGAGAIMMMWSPVFYLHRARVAAVAMEVALPAFSDLDLVARAGCLLSYGSDGYFNFRRAAYFVDRVLKGADAADLPVEQISKLMLIVNMKTADALGITIPQSILLRADEVIR
jgi:putative ABC transport system substrate-binding protein